LAFVNLEIGKAHLSQDELLEAFDALKAGFSLNGRVCAMAMMLGLVAIDLGEMQVAERALSAVTTMPSRSDAAPEGADPASRVIAYFHLASIAYEKGDIGRARRLATKAVTGDPDHVAARALLARLEVRSASARAPT
jgi:lipopolysaccharide biosynthesis regulator YciM